ncbi:binding-protein-dependent transport systems inner membrane component [Methylocella silvestris BL2]|uniref:Binding-protein-dependent transport systems inner membrane component n=1 Tax=Methylocella silvestris (strain DSM 15510 / CIP 108128 / LMG 27833 / NCIMB 13906 / BL2) TaxID=395965 RepID=B8EP75_METSB|nr:ABC transporter permease subunit [Methylocella silvestris]ACK49663.1 binding-protein-dependent transport systems inner membrane component [Methylocella silvestris BL2]
MPPRFVAFTSLGRKALPNQYDLLGLGLIFSAFIAIAHFSHGLTLPIAAPNSTVTSLDYAGLPYYAMRTTLRMFAAMAASLLFTFTYATLAAKSRRAELVLIPLLDILQSVPILGFLSFTVTFFLGLFPGSILGVECAAIFAIFTSQAWNMAFSFYQSLRSVPRDLVEVASGFQLSGWQRFWQLEAPFAMPGLIWNMMMSMSGGWFFVVASEAISVGDTTIKLPGVGSYLALAIEQKRIDAVFAAVVTMAIVILAYDQLLFRPLVAFGSRFRVELSAGQSQSRSFVRDLFLRTHWLRALTRPPSDLFQSFALWRLELRRSHKFKPAPDPALSRLVDILWFVAIAAMIAWSGWRIVDYVSTELTFADLGQAVEYTLFTLIRVVVLLALATIVWVPVGVWIGLRPALADKIQPLAQFLAAFPANVIFPIAVVLILRFSLNPDIWLSPLIVFGTQWYILFNVIAGAAAFPNDLKEAVAGFRIHGLDWWKSVMIPAIFPFYVTGALTASGGSWNAAIVAEYVRWGDTVVAAHGIGAYIAEATEKGDYPKIVLGVAVMAAVVILFNRLFWRPLFGLAERRLRLD